MSIVAPETFRERIVQYAKQNPETSVAEALGRFLAEPTDEQQKFVEEVLAAAGEDAPHDAGNHEGEVSA